MNKYISRILFSVFILISFCSTATHIVGGELNYRWLGGNNYEISLTVYRDCFNGQAPFDDPIAIGIFDVNDNLVNTIFITFPGSVPLVPTISSPCLIPPSN
ncbi:MAG: hypothetical protein JJE25_04065, partial [Bacteroidia bacterium]|nr:hypothetical protein [Bacteroidia bacterium]